MELEILKRAHVAERRDPREPRHQAEDDHHREPERRHREPGQAEQPQDVVERRVLPHGADDPGGHADEHREQGRERGQLEGDRHERPDDLPGRLIVPVGLAEVAREHLAEPVDVLDPVGPVDPELLHDRLLLGRAHVAGRREEDDRHAQQRQNGDDESLDDVGLHALAAVRRLTYRSTLPASGRSCRSTGAGSGSSRAARR